MNGSDKPYELTFELRPGYLYARLKADNINESNARAYCREVADELTRTRATRLLLDRDIPEILAPGPLYHVTLDFIEMIGDTKAAFVNPYRSNEEALDFAVMVGTNRGASYASFTNVADAEAWLLK